MKKLDILINLISDTQSFFKQQVQKQVNIGLTLRNWLFGFYIVEYELNGSDRAEYGTRLYKEIEKRLKTIGVLQIRERHLYLCKDFYLAYPNILRSAIAKSYLINFKQLNSLESAVTKMNTTDGKSMIEIEKLINQLSFTHFVELIKLSDPTQRNFYEWQSISNNWSVRELKRAINSMLYERTGLSKDKLGIIEKYNQQEKLLPEDVFRDPYILEFLELKEEYEYTELELEQAIINHLQIFLLELGKGFCFESRQKRITFDNTHYYIDLVFYHRILRCNILIDLKLGDFNHADAGQMNVYLNYYNENEKNEGDNPPVGIILCANKNESLVRYATTGLSQQIFVSKYLINLPDEDQLKQIIMEEQRKILSTTPIGKKEN